MASDEALQLLRSIDASLKKLVERGIAQVEPMAADGFDRFWTAYPRKDDKAKALKAWNKLAPNEALVQQMLAALAWQRNTDQWQRKIIPLPTTYLNGRRWEDEKPEGGLLDDDDEPGDPRYDLSKPFVPPATKPAVGGW
jgi:hypothetical protein